MQSQEKLFKAHAQDMAEQSRQDDIVDQLRAELIRTQTELRKVQEKDNRHYDQFGDLIKAQTEMMKAIASSNLDQSRQYYQWQSKTHEQNIF